MIVKELDASRVDNKFAKAGRTAEAQMAFYLRRAFQDSPDIFIFNDLRLEYRDDISQIDHLVLHRYGIIIVESKSVTTRIEVNPQEEWKRWTGSAWQGMASPILQAKRQAEFLEKYLEAHVDRLLNKTLGLQAHFGAMSTHWLVAISDNGIINRPQQLSLPEVCKADQIVDRIRTLVEQRKKANSFFNLNLKDVGFAFREDELDRIRDFLQQAHQPQSSDPPSLEKSSQPLTNRPIPPAKSIENQVTAPTHQHLCPTCQSSNLRIDYGYSYYFKCLQCGKNSSIDKVCEICGGKKRTRKSKLQFFSECSTCGTSELFHTNPIQ